MEREHFCIETITPQHFIKAARERAIMERPDNASGLEAAAVKSKLWKPGRTLRITFLEGDQRMHEKVKKYALEWLNYANLAFDFGTYRDAEIRIAFMQGDGSWSAIGTDALVTEWFPKDVPTMNYGWLTPGSTDKEYAEVVLHEFGHALGMIHEHQSAGSRIQWDRRAVIADLSGPPNNWNPETIEHNVFERYEATQTQFTEFDPKSIMLYSFPAHWTIDGKQFPRNSVLSESDKAFIKARYPK